MHRFRTYAESTAGAYRPERLQAVSLWLAQHARPGEIVFNVHWGMFPHLFFWSPGTYYINGMDPIFQYAYDPALYWKNHFLAFEDATAVTCGATRCTAGEVAETYAVLKRDFHASYIVVEKGGQAKLYRYLTSDPRFRKLVETDEDALFAIL